MSHKSVLLSQVVDYINIKPKGVYLDVTFGAGGHSRAILSADATVSVIGLDWDKISLDRFAPQLQNTFGNRFRFVWGNFATLYKIAKKERFPLFDGIIADFGTSQMQIMEKDGFSFLRDTFLDMRMSESHMQEKASSLVNGASASVLADIFWHFSQEVYAKRIARAIVRERKIKPITRTKQLADLVARIVPFSPGRHPATRVFQAIRIYINKELDNIVSFLSVVPRLLCLGGHIVCISFHSREDSIVKQYFSEKERELTMNILTKSVVVPSEEELMENRSARSAKLRAAQRIQ